MFALLFVVGSATAFMGFAAFAPGGDSSDRLPAIALFVLLLPSTLLFSGALYKAVFATRIAEKRWSRINRGLLEAGFRDATPAEVRETLQLPVQLLAPYILAEKRGGGIDHVTVGDIEGQEVRCFNVRIRGGGWIDVAVVALRVPASLASTVILSGSIPIRPHPGMQRVLYEHERFNRSMSVYSTDPFFASALVDTRMMAWLARDMRGLRIDLADRWVTVTCTRRRPAEPEALIEILEQFNERIPRAIPSLFPRKKTRRAWAQKSLKA
ncbi:MAG: hypothetical protein QOE83_2116 [Actinomycetota bacterium]|jgi:hypothetical protein|nr:hypothetical protein [Actinomycetota bacterium]